MNRCGKIDAPDDRYLKSVSGVIQLSHAHSTDENFAFANLGTVTEQDDAATVTDEQLPINLGVGSVYFLGGLEQHDHITSLVFTPAMVENTDYILNPITGKVTFLTDQSGSPGPTASYGYRDARSVSIQTAPQGQYLLTFEGWNLRNNDAEGKMNLWNTRFDPAKLVEFINEELQVLEMEGTMLVDPLKGVNDTIFGRFGRRTGF
jgi:hypothetical protein